MRLEQWQVIPIARGKEAVEGSVYGNPRFEDGKRVITSTVKQQRGNMITTQSGSVYKLGKPLLTVVTKARA